MKPEHAASRSNAAARCAPIFCCTRQAVAGNGMSGVMVATMIEVNLVGGDAGHFHRALRGLGRHVGGEFILRPRCAVP